MKKLLFSVLATIVSFQAAYSQDCKTFEELKGKSFVYKSFDAKDKEVNQSVNKVINTEQTDEGLKVTYEVTLQDANTSESLYTSGFSLICNNSSITLDMQKFLDPSTMSAYKDMNLEVTADKLDLPSSMQAGQTLNNGGVTAKVTNNGVTMVTISINILNRKVEAKESLQVSGTSYECYKLSYDVESKFGFIKSSVKVVEWYYPAMGLSIKSEQYDKKGKMLGRTELVSIK